MTTEKEAIALLEKFNGGIIGPEYDEEGIAHATLPKDDYIALIAHIRAEQSRKIAMLRDSFLRSDDFPLTPLYAAPSDLQRQMEEKERECEELRAKLAEAQKDAERYRWLKKSDNDYGVCVVYIKYWSDEYDSHAVVDYMSPDDIEKSIDAAMLAAAPKPEDKS
jgi:hypothetical protein